MPKLSIRPCKNEDIPALVELWRACDLIRPWNDPHHDIAFCRKSENSEIFLGVLKDMVAASVMCGHDGHRGWLYYLAVRPELQERGLGRQMTGHAEAWLHSLGIGKVQLMIRRENGAVRGFYESLGYAEEDRIIMSRRLPG